MKKSGGQFVFDVIRSVLYAILVSFVLILVFAVFVKIFSLSEKIITPVNAGIKTFSILVGILLGLKDKKAGLLKGLIAGVAYILLSFLIFALLDGGFDNANLTIFDVFLGAAAGIIAGVIKVNVKS